MQTLRHNSACPSEYPFTIRWVGKSRCWLNNLLDSASSYSSIVSIVAIGSSVRPRGHRRSDFDLLLLHFGQRPYIKAPIEVDIRYVPYETITELISQSNEVLIWALKYGKVLYDPHHLWKSLQNEWCHKLPLPSAEEAKRRAKKSLEQAIQMLQIGDESAADDLLLAALTQLAREQLIKHGIFPASRPELPLQLLAIDNHHPIAKLLERAMYSTESPQILLNELLSTRNTYSED